MDYVLALRHCWCIVIHEVTYVVVMYKITVRLILPTIKRYEIALDLLRGARRSMKPSSWDFATPGSPIRQMLIEPASRGGLVGIL